jgi:hypothetical protein
MEHGRDSLVSPIVEVAVEQGHGDQVGPRAENVFYCPSCVRTNRLPLEQIPRDGLVNTLGRSSPEHIASSAISSVIALEKSANGRKRRRPLEDPKSLRLRALP